MVIGACKVYMTAEWVCSLKEKRMVVKSLTERVRNKFNVSVAEVELQDVHRRIVIGFVCVTNSKRHADEILQKVLLFIENGTDAVVDNVEREIL